ncbi:hypothetical protein WICPIJ_002705 [Wickerhamomyces pijperi]|uniref:Uncharacterized protein n=1 Tax=Wickerhamomyces pijperi TaxID=599730 RepID=A0A9P8TNQ5_WICPI|nr:hypothetical protein WICPIJ_002705 [Wickerhamomyces pijperi]
MISTFSSWSKSLKEHSSGKWLKKTCLNSANFIASSELNHSFKSSFKLILSSYWYLTLGLEMERSECVLSFIESSLILSFKEFWKSSSTRRLLSTFSTSSMFKLSISSSSSSFSSFLFS